MDPVLARKLAVRRVERLADPSANTNRSRAPSEIVVATMRAREDSDRNRKSRSRRPRAPEKDTRKNLLYALLYRGRTAMREATYGTDSPQDHEERAERTDAAWKLHETELPWLGVDAGELARRAQPEQRPPPVSYSQPAAAQKTPMLSLYEALFPHEARLRKQQQQQQGSPSPANPSPVLPRLDSVLPLSKPLLASKQASKPVPVDSSSLQHAQWKEDRVVVMTIGGASPSLAASDFHRLIPRGSHISSWRTPGEFLQIIPGRVAPAASRSTASRDPTLLSPRRWYALVFGNRATAYAFRDNALRMHALAAEHTPTSLFSPPIPHKGYMIKGEDVHQVLADYTLYPPSAMPDINVLSAADNYTLGSLLRHKGYEPLRPTHQPAKAGRAVRLWVDGHRPTEQHVVTMLARDGRDRGLHWAPFDGSGAGDMVRLYDSSEGDGAGVESDARAATPMFRWLLSFRDEAEARRFVRTWHLRPFRLAPELRTAGEPLPRVHAEFMW